MAVATGVQTKRAVGYFRVSSSRQAGERHSSLETQESRFHDYSRRYNLVPAGTFTDIVTGRRDDRKEYHRMLDLVIGGGADYVVVQWLDRFGRNPREILRRYWELEEHGVKVVATDEDIQEELVLLIKAGMAGAESKRTSERVRANMGRAISKGVHAGRPPYGLKPVGEVDKGKMRVRWEIDPEEQPAVREMVRLALDENLGFKAIGDRLTAAGYRARGGRPFAAFTVQEILTNPALSGRLVYGRKPRTGNPKTEVVEVPNFFPPILSQEEWQRLKERLSIRRESPKGQSHASVYLLGGIARCGHCGGPMVGKVGYAYKGKRYRNYYCSRAMRSRGLCAFYNGHSAPKLEQAVIKYLQQFSDPEMVRQYLAASDHKEIERQEAELREVEKRLADYEAQFFTRLNDLLKRKILSDEEFARANHAARAEAAALETKRAGLKALVERGHATTLLAESLPRSIKSFVDEFEHADIRLQKAELQTILKAVRVHKDMRLEVEFRDQNRI